MNAINKLFSAKQKDILSVFFTAGFPELEDTVPIMQSLINHGVDMIEIGMPYSDPVADGPVIEQSSARALKNGMTIGKLFSQLQDFHPQKKVPLILMGYLNPVMQYGYERFCKDAARCGISGMIIPDLPVDVYDRELKPFTEKYGLHFIFLITPETSEQRIRIIDEMSGGFIYAVSSSSVTGRDTDESLKEAYFSRLQSYHLKTPVLIGFGIKDAKTFGQACRYVQGAIIGTAFIRQIENERDFEKVANEFTKVLGVSD